MVGDNRDMTTQKNRQCSQCQGSGKEDVQAADRGNNTYSFPCGRCYGTGVER